MNRLPNNRFSFFLHFVSKQKMRFFLFLLTSLAVALSSSIWPFITGKLTDAIASYSDDKALVFEKLGGLFLGAIVFWAVVELFTRVQGLLAAKLYPSFESDIRMNSFEYVNNHSHSYFANNYVGSIANRIGELPRSSSVVIDFLFTNLIPLLISIAISTFLFFQLDMYLSAVMLSWLLLHLIICTIGGVIASNLSTEHSESRTQLQGKIVDTLNNHLNVKIYTQFLFEVENVQLSQFDERKKNQITLFFVEKIKILLSFVALGFISWLLYLSITFWQIDQLSLGDLIFIFGTTLNLLALAWNTTIEMSFLFRELGVIKQALKIVWDPVDVREKAEAFALSVENGDIEFNKVTFRYRRNDNVFQEKSLTIKGGQKIGLVGFSGSGKTTFAHLILRLFDIESGSITIDGQNISDVTLKSLRDNICLIPQEPMLFNRSIMDNIRYSVLDATDDEVIEASKRANCHEFIMHLEDGYDTIVGEKGSKISGGQKQRIAIARAILKKSPILIMDEATSALDSYTEKLIRDSIRYLAQDKTTIIIAHRLSTLLEMDRILVFDNGTIIEDGNHDELIQKDGHYALLWKMQTAGVLPISSN